MAGGHDETRDATRRTQLANERTVLAWWRSGLAAFAVALGVGRVVPELAGSATRWPYSIVGAGFSLLGVAYIAYGHRRQGEVDAALRRGDFVRPDSRVMACLTAAGIVLGIATVVLVSVE